MSDFAELTRLWAEFRQRAFPESVIAQEVDGVCLVTTDSFAAGCIETALTNGGRLDDAQRTMLIASMSDLDRIFYALDGEALSYFVLLRQIGTRVLGGLSKVT